MNTKSNYDIAKERADEIDQVIIDTLAAGKSYRVEAGAGAGKTYSLKKAIDWLDANRGKELKSKKQKVACITYTNAAVEVIKKRLPIESSVIPTTIHTFAWENISYFKKALVNLVKSNAIYPEDCDPDDIREVQYTLGVKYVEDNVLYLHHNDVIKLFGSMLDNAKFRHILASRYPIILIDEYQDSFESLMERFVKYFIQNNGPIQFGLYGDGWQTIYASNGACGTVEDKNLCEIKKESNFRSQTVIVEILNRLRPELPQISALNEDDGRAFVITCDDYRGARQIKYYKDELPNDELQKRVRDSLNKLIESGWDEDHTKVLMLTHKLLARQQGYDQLLTLLDEGLKSNDDPLLLFFNEKIEPIIAALKESDSKSLSAVIGTQRLVLDNKNHKKIWHDLLAKLETSAQKTIYDVLTCVVESKLIPVPDAVASIYNDCVQNPNATYPHSNFRTKELFDVPYKEVRAANAFLCSESVFETEHGIKGEEYDNVLLVVGRGWNDYKFDYWMPMNEKNLCDENLKAYIRNRNLFYVCCSRPKKNLALLVTVPVTGEFRAYLARIFGSDNIIAYPEFVK